MMPVSFYVNCSVGRYHWFKVLSSNEEAQKEVCRHCGVNKTYKFRKDGQLVNNEQYFLDHIRAFAQPAMGDVYYDINPGMLLKFKQQEEEQKKSDEYQAEMGDKFKFAIKRALQDKDDGIKKKK